MRVLTLVISLALLTPLAAAGRPLAGYDPAHAGAPVHASQPDASSDDGSDRGFVSSSGATGVAVVLFMLGVLAFVGLRSGMVGANGRLTTESDDVGPTRIQLPAADPWEAELQDVLPGIAAGWVEQLCADDPAFRIDALLERAKTVFLRTQEAWFLRALSPVRSLMSDATYQRFGTQLALLEEQGLREAQTDVRVRGVQLVGFVRSEWFHTVQLAVDVQLRRAMVAADLPDDEARRIAESRFGDSWVEVWSFVRKAGARTAAGRDLLGGKCPQCGAPFLGGPSNQCDHCQAIVNSGNYDWTLAEITRGRELVEALRPSEIVGLTAARTADPALNLQILEDRASLVFWKWIEARVLGEPRRLAKLAPPEAQRSLVGEGPRERFLDLRVSGVDTQSFEITPHEQRATVEVRWHGQTDRGTGAADGLHGMRRRTRLLLARGPRAKTRTDNGMSTSRCPGCNAPLTDSLSARCDYCQAPLGVSADEWVLMGEETVELNG